MPNTWEKVIENYETKEYVPVHVTIDGTRIDSVGLRIKGNRLNYLPYQPPGLPQASKKQSLKLDFNEFRKKQEYDGLKKINLKNRNVVANHLLYKLALDYNIPSCRTSLAKVYLDNEYIGSYLLIEQIDKTYLKQTFNNKKGNLYKASGKGGLLEYLGADVSQYQYPYEKKTNEKENDYSDLIGLLNFFSNSSSTDFEKDIENHFNIDNFVKALAIEMIVSKRDAFYDAGRNYYLYNNPKRKQFEYIVDDFDYTMSQNEYTDLNFQKVKSEVQPFVGSPIITQIIQSAAIKKKYYQAVCDILNNGFKNLDKEIDRLEALAKQHDFNLYDLMDVNNSSQSLKEYINKRVDEINTELKESGFICNITSVEQINNSEISVFPTLFQNDVTIKSVNNTTEYRLFDSMGKLVENGSFTGERNTLNLQHLPAGFYFLQVSTINSNQTFKLIKGY